MFRLSGISNLGRALGHRNYRLYAAGNLVSLLGFWVQRLAVGWLTWELTHSGAWLGIMAFAELLPTLLIGPIAGAVVDRSDYRRISIIAQSLATCQATILFLLTVSGLITIEGLLVLTVFQGVAVAFNQPSRLALVPSLVPRQDLSAAIAISSLTFNSARFAGPALAGPILATAGVGAAFAFNALTYVVFIAALVAIRIVPRQRPTGPRTHMLGDVVAGFRYTLAHAGIGPMMLVVAAASLLTRPYMELLPGFADAVFGRGAFGLVVLTSATGFGAMLASMWLAWRGTTNGLTAIAVHGLLAGGIVLLVFSATDFFWLGAAALILVGFTNVATGVGSQILLQSAVAGEMRGRVLGLYGITARVCPALGALIIGGASEYVGLQTALAVAAALCIIAWTWAARRRGAMAGHLEPEAAR